MYKKNDALITIESDKSSVEIPSSHNGKIKSLKLKLETRVQRVIKILDLEAEIQMKQKTNEEKIIANKIQ